MDSIEDNFENIAQNIDRLKNGIENDAEKYDEFHQYILSSRSIIKFNVFIEKLLIEKEKSLRRDKMIAILIDVIFESENFENLIMTTSIRKQTMKYSSFELDKFINILVSFPELIANLYGPGYPHKFETKNYIARLCRVLQQILDGIYRVEQAMESFIMHHMHCIIRRLCLRGYQELIWIHLFENLFNKLIDDVRWMIITQHILFSYHREEDDDDGPTISEMSKFLEPLFKMILHHSSSPKSMEILFPFDYLHKHHDSLLSKIEFLLTNKFILIYHCPLVVYQNNNNNNRDDQFIYNLLGYLFRANRKWFINASLNVMDAWSNSNAFNYRQYQQQFYFCRLMILFTRLLLLSENQSNVKDMEKIIKKLQSSTFIGSTINLACSQQEFRNIGLTTSVILFDLFIRFNSIDIELPKFPELDALENDDCCKHLKYLGSFDLDQLFDNVQNQNEISTQSMMTNDDEQTTTTTATTDDNVNIVDMMKSTTFDSDDDDDDDLEPYDISNDIPIGDDVRFTKKNLGTSSILKNQKNIQDILLIDSSKQRPIYLQDLIEGLCSDDEKSEWKQKCLQSAEKIIRANTDHYNQLDSVSLRLAKILVDLDNNGGIENFDQLRLNSLIALCVGSPKIVASYLADRFYAPYISIQNRLDVLAVLTKASEELCQLQPFKYKDHDKFIKPIPENSQKLLSISEKNQKFQRDFFTIDTDYNDDGDRSEQQNWKSIIEQRIKSNTRFISPIYHQKHSESSTMSSSSNRFVPFAKYFFFPLLRDFEKMDLKLKINDIDSFIVESLILALGILLQNCHQHSQTMLMSKELLPFIYSYRNHSKSNVRSAIIQTFKIVLQSTPGHYLLNELSNQMIDFKIWLQDIIIDDLNQNCMIKAYQVMMTLDKMVNQIQSQLTQQQSSLLIDVYTYYDNNNSNNER
ncbi:telomere length regulation protein TEL2 homolog isoform X2 [Dermatophagoides farinae]|uniref:telomere length regulation protein TEL2 homolog isoform X2 n=1 Tax=Dermatophagoides farinae TaxID=6954 RepID=UPI003F6283B6